MRSTSKLHSTSVCSSSVNLIPTKATQFGLRPQQEFSTPVPLPLRPEHTRVSAEPPHISPRSPPESSTMSLITSLPTTAVSERVSQANSFKELVDLIPVNVRPPLAMLCEEIFKISQKASTIGVAVDELLFHQEKGTLPRTIAVTAPKVQTIKEFAGSGAQRLAMQKLYEEAATYAKKILYHTLAVKQAELEYLRKLQAPALWTPKVTAIADDLKKRLGQPSRQSPTDLAATPSSTPTGQAKALETSIFETGWEKSLPLFVYRAIALGDATV